MLANDEWYHLATIDPSDGKLNWDFTSKYWYSGSLGQPSGGDYIDETIRRVPIKSIKISSTNSAGQTAWKVWPMLEENAEKSFAELMRDTFNESITQDHVDHQFYPSGFEFDPLMSIDGPIALNKLFSFTKADSQGTRLYTTG